MTAIADTYVRARIDTKTKERAAEALESMGLSISDVIRMLMIRVADEGRLPFDVNVPNPSTRKPFAELEVGKGKRFAKVNNLMVDLVDKPKLSLKQRLKLFDPVLHKVDEIPI